MKLDTVWLHPEMQELFEKLAALRDIAWAQCRIELGDDLPETATSTQIAPRRLVCDDRRRAEIVAAYRQIASGYERKMADLEARYAAPQIVMRSDQPKQD